MAKKKLHWTQRPENKVRLKKQLRKMNEIRKNGKTKTAKSLSEAIGTAKNGDTILVNTTSEKVESAEVFRANPSSYVLIVGTRVPIQDLSHESLCNRYTLVKNETSNLQRELDSLRELESNLRAEKFYRKL